MDRRGTKSKVTVFFQSAQASYRQCDVDRVRPRDVEVVRIEGEAKEKSKEDRDAEWGFLPFQMMYLG